MIAINIPINPMPAPRPNQNSRGGYKQEEYANFQKEIADYFDGEMAYDNYEGLQELVGFDDDGNPYPHLRAIDGPAREYIEKERPIYNANHEPKLNPDGSQMTKKYISQKVRGNMRTDFPGLKVTVVAVCEPKNNADVRRVAMGRKYGDVDNLFKAVTDGVFASKSLFDRGFDDGQIILGTCGKRLARTDNGEKPHVFLKIERFGNGD